MKNLVFSVVLLVVFSGCYSPAPNLYNSEKTPGVDFNNYKTFAWLAPKDTAFTKLVSKQSVSAALSHAVWDQLTSRGMVMDTAHPDCLFTYSLVLNKSYQVGQEPNPVYSPTSNTGALPGQYNMYYYSPGYEVNYNPSLYEGGMKVNTFRDGTLVIDMIDRKTNKIIWRTSAEGKVQENERQGVRPTVNEIVPVMFKKFPIKK